MIFKHIKTVLVIILSNIAISSRAQFHTVQSFKVIDQISCDSIRKKNTDSITERSTSKGMVVSIRTRKQNLLALPLKRIKVTSNFGKRYHPLSKSIKIHNGIDLRARYEEVYSMFPGEIYRIGEDKISGKYIIVATGNYLISYCHLSKIHVQHGSLISAGDLIGISGNSGRSTAPHLHITCKIKGKLVNPKYFIDYILSQQENK